MMTSPRSWKRSLSEAIAWVPIEDADRAVRHALAEDAIGRSPRRPRQGVDAHAELGEAPAEGRQVLADQNRRRRDQRHLLAGEDGGSGGAQRHLGLAEADVAADQAVHRPAAGEIAQHRVDCPQLVGRFRIGKMGGEPAIAAGRSRKPGRRRPLPLLRELHQRPRRFLDFGVHPRLPLGPAIAGQPVERNAGVGRAVPPQLADLLGGHQQLLVRRIRQRQALVRATVLLQQFEGGHLADTVLRMRDEITDP